MDRKWDFEVPGYHHYWLGGVLHHNSGKTQAGRGIIARLVRREGPIYQRLRNPRGRRLKVWVAPLTGEKWRSNWEQSLLGEVLVGLGATYVQSPHPVITGQDRYGGWEIWGKSQDQGYRAFEGDPVDLIIVDEEPEDPRIYSSCMQRFATTNGCLVFTFTPLLGMDWTHTKLYEPVARPAYQRRERVWRKDNVTLIQMGMADNPAAKDGAARLAADPVLTDQEKRTRLFGEYGFVEGLLFPWALNWRDYWLPGLPPNRPYSWVLTIDPNKRHGGLLTAIDHTGNRFYVAEHYAVGKSDTEHATAYQEMMARFQCRPDVYADPGGAGAQAIVNVAEHGIFAAPVPKDAGSVKASIDLVNRAAWVDPWHPHPTDVNERGFPKLGAPHAWFLPTLCTSSWDGHMNESRLIWELQRYRQKPGTPPGTPVKADDDLVDCLRYLELVRPFSPEEPDTREQRLKETLDSTSYREAQASRQVLARAAAPQFRTRVDPDMDFELESDLT